MNRAVGNLIEILEIKEQLEKKIVTLKENLKKNCGRDCIYYTRHKDYSSGSYYDSAYSHVYMKCSLCDKYECIEKG
ncbi:MAG: hypothetical protein NTZ20_05390 [Candidatus Levybacteria bacterium]|nr:hypothetical protein [Candidatus Levybacteria bacterium]